MSGIFWRPSSFIGPCPIPAGLSYYAATSDTSLTAKYRVIRLRQTDSNGVPIDRSCEVGSTSTCRKTRDSDYWPEIACIGLRWTARVWTRRYFAGPPWW